MNINEVIIYLLLLCMTLGALDKVFGNKFGLGAKFEEGFMAMGSLALAMIGIISLAPVLVRFLEPFIIPLYKFFGSDPSMFAGTFFANDMGGYSLALKLAENHDAGLFSGLFVGAMMGATIVFTIPVALNIIEKKDHRFLALGILSGLVTVPIGAFFGGLIAGFNVGMLFLNLVPLSLVAFCIIIFLWNFPETIIRCFAIFGKVITTIITLATVAIIIETVTGFVLIPGMTPLNDCLKIIGSITIILAGAYPMVYLITKLLQKPLSSVGKIMGINEKSVTGLIASLANNIPMFGIFKEMDDKGKVINVAFAVSAAFVFGDHIGFTAGVNHDMIFPVIMGKLIGGFTAIIVAGYVYKHRSNEAKFF